MRVFLLLLLCWFSNNPSTAQRLQRSSTARKAVVDRTPEAICSTSRKDLKFYISKACEEVASTFKTTPLLDTAGRCGTRKLWEALRNSTHITSVPSAAHFIYCPSHLAHLALEHHEELARFDPTGHRVVYGVNTADLGWSDFRLVGLRMAPTPTFWKQMANSTLLSFFAIAQHDSGVCNKNGTVCKGDFRVGQDISMHAINSCPEDALLAKITPWRTGTWLPKRNLTFYFSGRSKMSQTRCRRENNLADGSTECAAVSSRGQIAKVKLDGFVVAGMPSSYEEDVNFIKRSVFCFAPVGVNGGYGFRYVRAIMNGCIPVIMNDGRPLPYDDVLDYRSFAVVIRKGGTVHEMVRQLEKMQKEPAKIAKLQDGLSKVW
eukprot:CAMPEP_0198203770 /NCGR_PEP_ID=MMETSP1445-20131203/7096_1 /TAXON_ID=36898 /ORGANISM="Pyramimonas sp., Strain CCMP2087" /LENGTH=374 /DNA_ID=CAMNT_0043875297 /DNA_START=216 /DNA_END=1337 /DNA_ORIENTATION=-